MDNDMGGPGTPGNGGGTNATYEYLKRDAAREEVAEIALAFFSNPWLSCFQVTPSTWHVKDNRAKEIVGTGLNKRDAIREWYATYMRTT